MPPTAYVVHRTRQRVRLRIPQMRGDTEWFAETAAALESLDWVDRVETGPISSSLILFCDATERLDDHLSKVDVFEFQREVPKVPPAAEQMKNGLSRIDRALHTSSLGDINLRSLLFLLMLVLAGVQMVRGKVMAPAISLLWYAMELVLGAGAPAQPKPEVESDRQS